MANANLKRVFLVMGIFVCLASAAVSGICGNLAGTLYEGGFFPEIPMPSEDPEAPAPPSSDPLFDVASPMGVAFGAIGGLGAGLLWVRTMRRQTLQAIDRAHRIRPGLILLGTFMGIVVGAAATVFLHLALDIAAWQGIPTVEAIIIVMGYAFVMFTLPAGAGLGLLSGFAWWLICRAELRRPSSEAATEGPTP